MMFSLYAILEASLLVLNGIAVLNKERFLKKIGLTTSSNSFEMPDPSSIRMQLINLIVAVQTVMRVPLIAVNIFVIAVKLLLGWTKRCCRHYDHNTHAYAVWLDCLKHLYRHILCSSSALCTLSYSFGLPFVLCFREEVDFVKGVHIMLEDIVLAEARIDRAVISDKWKMSPTFSWRDFWCVCCVTRFVNMLCFISM